MAVHQRLPPNLTEQERICKEEWQRIPKSRCEKLVYHLQFSSKNVQYHNIPHLMNFLPRHINTLTVWCLLDHTGVTCSERELNLVLTEGCTWILNITSIIPPPSLPPSMKAPRECSDQLNYCLHKSVFPQDVRLPWPLPLRGWTTFQKSSLTICFVVDFSSQHDTFSRIV